MDVKSMIYGDLPPLHMEDFMCEALIKETKGRSVRD